MPRTDSNLYHAFSVGAACWFTASAIVAIYLLQIVLAQAGLPLLVPAIIADAVVVAGAYLFARHHGLGWSALGMVAPRAGFIAAAVLVGCSAWYLNLLVIVALKPPGDVEPLHELVEQPALVSTLVGVAVMPALAEELVFRGVFARALAHRLAVPLAIGISAIVFGVYHFAPPQIVSNVLFGAALAFLALRARSVLPSMIAHALNNAIAIVLARDELPALNAWMGANDAVMLTLTLALFASGVLLAAVSGPPSPR